jgi:curved DNA-binding protein CbpA
MPSADLFRAWVESMPTMSYYGILRVPDAATVGQIKAAFHSLALRCHPDRYVDDDPAVAEAAAEVFKRAVEAYNVLTKPKLRARYDEALKRGKLRLDPSAIDSAPPPPPMRTLEMVTRDPKARVYAVKADRLLSIGKLEDARLQLINACQLEPHNEELQERLKLLYEALALEPL